MGLRLPGSTDADIEQAIIAKEFVRTSMARGTLQLVAAADIRWMLALVTPRIITSIAARYKELELDEAIFTQTKKLLVKALEGGKQQTRSELFTMLEQEGIATPGQRGVHILNRAAMDGLICQGLMQGKDTTYMLLDEALPPTPAKSRDEAVIELVRRYFTSRAPATLQDFVWWSGLTLTDARKGMAELKSEFHEVKIDDQTYWLPEKMPDIPKRDASVYLLPGFDEYLISYRDRSASLDPLHANKIVPGGNGVFMATIVSEGRVVGIWKRAVKKQAIQITLHPFDTLTASELEGISAAARRYGEFMGLDKVEVN